LANGSGGNGVNVWKWIAGMLAAIMLAGAPGIVFALRAPTPAQLEQIKERQQLVLQRLAVLEEQVSSLELEVMALRADLDEERSGR
jgi:hypothetical protein